MAQAYGVWVNIGHGGGVNVRANKDGSISAACVWQPLAHEWFKFNTDAAVDVKFCKLGYAAVVLIMMVGHCYVVLTMVFYSDDVDKAKAEALHSYTWLACEIHLSFLVVEWHSLRVIQLLTELYSTHTELF